MPEQKAPFQPHTDAVVIDGQTMSFAALTKRWAEDRRARRWERFRVLAERWRTESAAMSSITEMATLPSYQKIIGLGEDAIPMILAQLKAEGDEPSQWFWALRALTDANPVDPHDQGNFTEMARAWVAWGEREGYAG